jgi:hypothetical protein
MSRKDAFSRLALTASLLCLCIFTTVVLFRHSSLVFTTPVTADNATERVQNIKFTIYDVGIYPQEMSVDAGRIGIAVDDRTGRSAGVSLQRLNGNSAEPVGQVQMVADHHRSRGYIKLTPGRYRVVDQSHPQIFSTLIVNP